jgi:hypothetical protein
MVLLVSIFFILSGVFSKIPAKMDLMTGELVISLILLLYTKMFGGQIGGDESDHARSNWL